MSEETVSIPTAPRNAAERQRREQEIRQRRAQVVQRREQQDLSQAEQERRSLQRRSQQTFYGALTIDEFCARYGVSRTKVYLLLGSGEIVAKKAGRRTVIPVAEAERWLASLPDAVVAA